jgi:large subunit ribosomal protein L4
MVEPFAMDAPKTKEFIQILENIKANGRRTLFVLPQGSENIYKSSRNLQNVNVITIYEINTYNIMNAYQLVLVDGVQDIIAARRK